MDGFSTRRSGSVGHEIVTPEGEIVAWTVDGWWAAVIVALLNDAEERGLYRYESEIRSPDRDMNVT